MEVGPGLGAITEPLLDIYPDMHAIEIDQRAVSHLKEHYPQLDVRHADVLDTNWGLLSDEVRAPLAVIGNLPYNVVSQILFSLLEARRGCIGLAVVMMQKEVADRIVAPTKCKAYGILSVVAQLYSRPKLLFPVPNTAFFPKPDVTSAMVEFEFVPNSHFDVTDLALAATLRNVLRTAFNQRRKVLRNSLRPICDEIGKELPDSFGKKRAEEISPTDFIRLTRFLYGEQMKSGLWNENDRTSVWR